MRQHALQIFTGILDERIFLSEFTDDMTPWQRQLVTTALRYLGFIDHLLGQLYKKPPSPKTLHHLLRLAATEILYLKNPSYAVVNEYVNMSRRIKGGRQSGFVNGVLRNLDRQKEGFLALDPALFTTPQWLRDRWQKTYGREAADKISAIHLEIPPLDLTLKSSSLQIEGENLFETTQRLHHAGKVSELPGYHEGQWWVQDVAAGFPVKLLGDIRGKQVVDIGAAPGGKTAQLCAAGADVTALDFSAARLKRLQENMKRLGFSPAIVESDGLDYKPDALFDIAVLDAPCSATGTIRRHPDLPWIRDDKDLLTQTSIQAALLKKALTLVKPGGTVLYCTCSLEPEEGEMQISKLAEGGLCKIIPVDKAQFRGTIPEAAITAAGMLRTLPFYHQGMDGFFAAVLQRPA